MATEDDALRTLQNIEKLLKSATALSANKANFSGRTQQSQKERADREVRKAFKAVAASAKDLKDSFMGLDKSLIGLNDEVGSTTKTFGALNSQMAKFMSSLQPIQVPDNDTTFVHNQALIQTIGIWGKSTVTAIENLAKILQQQPPKQAESESFFARIFGKSTTPKNTPKAQTPVPKDFEDSFTPVQSVMQRLMMNFGKAAATSGGLAYAFEKLIDITGKVATDYYELARVGMGTVQNLKDLYIYAAQAGMTFEEYNNMLRTSMTIAGKAGTLENFNKIISAQDETLARMGIFGKESRQLQASLAQSTALMGVNINDVTKATAAQVKTFDKLRRVAGITADEFANMVSSLSKNADVQRELVGLQPHQRSARMQELLQLQTIGMQMGMTAEASKQLGDALIKQRQATVKERIEQGSALMQLAAFTGNGAMGQRAYELNMKGRRRSKAEDEELLTIVRQLDSQAQGLYENGSLGMQNALDHFDEALNKGNLGDLIKQGRGATLAKDAGTQNQEAFGHHVSDFGKFVGELTAWTRGIKESIAMPIVAAIGAGMLAMFRGPIIKMITKAAGFKGAAKVTDAATAGSSILDYVTEPFKKAKGAGSSFMQWFKEIPTTVANSAKSMAGILKGIPGFFRNAFNSVKLTNAISGPLNTMKFIVQEFGSKLAVGGRGAITATEGVLNGLVRSLGRFPVIAGLFDAAIEMFTGDLSTALNPNGGMFNRIGGMITAFFSAIPKFMIETLAFVFGPEALKPIRNGFDIFVAFMNMAIKDFLARMVGGLADTLSYILPSDSGLVKMLNGWRDGLVDSAAENALAVEKLWGDQSKTLASISEENKKVADAKTQQTQKATAQAQDATRKFNNVIAADDVSAAGVVSDAKTLMAQPETQVQKPVQPAPVNTGTTTEGQTQIAQKTEEQKPDVSGEILKALQDIAQVLRESLSAEQLAAYNSTELLNRLQRNPVSFQSPEEVQRRLLKRGS